jgi:hypothetical protein
VEGVRIDPDSLYPDVNPGNNEWRSPRRTTTP